MNKQPNILIINVDQQRYDSLGFTGNPVVKTPNIDRLAAKGMQFDSAYTPLPVCCPARQTFLSGVMPEQHGGLWNFDSTAPVGTITGDTHVWVRQLREAGYGTDYLGKWHAHPSLDPTAFGFDTFEDPGCGNFETSHKAVKYALPNNPWPQFPIGAFEDQPLEQCHTHLLAAKCNEVINRRARQASPWHIRLDYSEPHLPCLPAEPFASMYPPESIPPWKNFNETFENKPFIQKQQLRNWGIEDWTWKEWAVYMSGYYGIISQLDDAIGRVINHLEARGLMDNTLIIYTTDHGDAAGSHRMMDKHYVMYEEEVHVPMVMRWDGVISPGSTCGDFISHYLDLPVTLLELLGLAVPNQYQGRSFLPQLKGEDAVDPWEFAFSTYNGQQFGLYCQRMVRDRQYKYVWNPTDVDEFYDLINDPYELVNLAEDSQYATLSADYRKKVYEVFAGLKDPLVANIWNQRWLSGSQ